MIKINENEIEWKNGMTVTDALKKMGYDYSLIATTVNEQFVSQEEYDEYLVPDQADIKFLHICHGG